MKDKLFKFLIICFLISTFFIFYRLGSSPPGALIDEASLGYNAFSILHDGRDEWGDYLPLTLKSFGDFKPAGYIYFAAPFVKMFGLSLFSVRLPSAIFGVISIICLFFIVRSLTKNSFLSLVCSIILSISPWHIYMSRMAWEANLSLSMFLIGLALLLNRIDNRIFVLFSAVFFGISMYVYVGYKILIPLFLFVALIFLFKQKALKLKNLFLFLFIFLLINIPQIAEVFKNSAGSRFSQVSVFNQVGTQMYVNEQRAFCGMQGNKFLLKFCYVFWNKYTTSSSVFVKNYLMGFSTDFLFFSGDKGDFINNSNHGGLYLWLFPLFIIGLTVLINKINQYGYRFILLWFLIAPLMSAFAGQPHFVRSNMILIPTSIICGIGIIKVIEKIKKFNLRLAKLFIGILILLSYGSLIISMTDYFFVYTKKAMAWDEYYQDISDFLANKAQSYDYIVFKKITNHPYIYLLFYQATDPEVFRKTSIRNGFNVLSFSKYNFVDSDFTQSYCQWKNSDKPKTLYIMSELKDYYDPVFVVKSFNGVHVRAVVYDLEQTDKYLSNKFPERIPICQNKSI